MKMIYFRSVKKQSEFCKKGGGAAKCVQTPVHTYLWFSSQFWHE